MESSLIPEFVWSDIEADFEDRLIVEYLSEYKSAEGQNKFRDVVLRATERVNAHAGLIVVATPEKG